MINVTRQGVNAQSGGSHMLYLTWWGPQDEKQKLNENRNTRES